MQIEPHATLLARRPLFSFVRNVINTAQPDTVYFLAVRLDDFESQSSEVERLADGG